jgi:hypothetical protein
MEGTMSKGADRRKGAKRAVEPVNGLTRVQRVGKQIVSVLNGLSLEAMKSRLGNTQCPAVPANPAPVPKKPATFVGMVFRTQDAVISEGVEQIKADVLELLDELDLPQDLRSKVRKDLEQPGAYLEPQCVCDFDFTDQCNEDEEAARRRNLHRLDRLSRVQEASRKKWAPTGQPRQLDVDVRRRKAILDGKEYPLEIQLAVYLDLVVRANGKPVTNKQVLQALREEPGVPEQCKKEFRVTREANRLPPPLRELVGRKAGCGSWLL